MSRQNFYKEHRKRQKLEVDEDYIEQLVRIERAKQSRLGGRKLHVLLKKTMAGEGIRIGRDRFFEVLRNRSLLVPPLPRSSRTTNSRHSLPVFRNLVKDHSLTGPNEAWAADLTYLRTDEGYLYLSLITDMHSRKIVGFHAGDTLEAEGCLRSLKMAVKHLPSNKRPIHHSDRGSQYCSHLYAGFAMEHGLTLSMTEVSHCYENALAERVNGILKQEYWLGGTFKTKQQARRCVAEAVLLYNTCRPHQSLGYKIPDEVHRQIA